MNYNEFLKELERLTTNITIDLKLNGFDKLTTELSKITTQLDGIKEIDASEALGSITNFISILSSVDNLVNARRVVETSFDQMSKALTSDTRDIQKIFKKLGKYVGKGIVDGLKESLSDVKFVTNQLGKKGIVKTFETTMDMKSPSKVMKRLGQYVVAGLGDGIEDKLRDIKKSMSKLTDAFLHHRISSQGFI